RGRAAAPERDGLAVGAEHDRAQPRQPGRLPVGLVVGAPRRGVGLARQLTVPAYARAVDLVAARQGSQAEAPAQALAGVCSLGGAIAADARQVAVAAVGEQRAATAAQLELELQGAHRGSPSAA